jgi:hypothetical protein
MSNILTSFGGKDPNDPAMQEQMYEQEKKRQEREQRRQMKQQDALMQMQQSGSDMGQTSKDGYPLLRVFFLNGQNRTLAIQPHSTIGEMAEELCPALNMPLMEMGSSKGQMSMILLPPTTPVISIIQRWRKQGLTTAKLIMPVGSSLSTLYDHLQFSDDNSFLRMIDKYETKNAEAIRANPGKKRKGTLQNAVGQGDESVCFSAEVGWRTEGPLSRRRQRLICVTNFALYTMTSGRAGKIGELRRRIELQDLQKVYIRSRSAKLVICTVDDAFHVYSVIWVCDGEGS